MSLEATPEDEALIVKLDAHTCTKDRGFNATVNVWVNQKECRKCKVQWKQFADKIAYLDTSDQPFNLLAQRNPSQHSYVWNVK